MTFSDALLNEREAMRNELEGITARGNGVLSADDEIKLLSALFFVKWSEIRKDAAKLLQQYEFLQENGAKSLLNMIFGEISGKDDIPWQKLHGALLGVNAILGKVEDIDENLYQQTKSLCLRLQGNPQLPIREQVHKCLVHLFKRSEERERLNILNGLLHDATNLINERQSAAESLGYMKTPSPSSSRSPTKGFNFDSSAISSPRTNSSIERTAYVLEGTLAYIHSVFECSSDLFLLLAKTLDCSTQQSLALESVFTSLDASNPSSPDQESDTSSPTSTRDVAKYKEASFYVVIWGCLGDISSTVRQAAAQALLALVARSDKEATTGNKANKYVAGAISKAIHEDLTDRLSAAYSLGTLNGSLAVGAAKPGQSWLELEACLLLSEGLLKSRLDLVFDSLESETVDESAVTEGSHIYQYLLALVSALEMCVLNTAFEIKRAATQVVPLLVRLLSLRFPRLLFQNLELEAEPDPEAMRDTSEQAPTDSPTIQRMLRTIYSFYWISEVTKASQHIREVLHGASDGAKSLKLDPDLGIGHASPEAHAMWALEVSGRLAEEANKTYFRQRLMSLVPEEAPSRSPSAMETSYRAKGVLEYSLEFISRDLVVYMPVLQARWTSCQTNFEEWKGHQSIVVALDVAEASALATCAVHGITIKSAHEATSTTDSAVSMKALQAWAQGDAIIPHLLRTTGGRYRVKAWGMPAQDIFPSGKVQSVLIIPSLADPGIDPSAILSPLRQRFGSPRNMESGAVSAHGLTPNSMSPRSVYATNRQFCESVAPVLPMLSLLHSRFDGGGVNQLAHIIAVSQLSMHWINCCLSDAQFLERRQHLRNGLCAALGTFLQKIEALCRCQHMVSSGEEEDTSAGTADLSNAQEQLLELEYLVVGAIHMITGQIDSRNALSAHDALTCGTLARTARLVASSFDNFGSTLSDDEGRRKRTLSQRTQLVMDLTQVKTILQPVHHSPSRSNLYSNDKKNHCAAITVGDNEVDRDEASDEEEFSDWDESSEELNISVNSISAIREEEERENCIQEIDNTLEYLS